MLKADSSGDLTVHAEDCCDLFLCEEEDLEHEVIAFFGAAAHAGLTHQDDAGQQDRFEGHDGAEERKGSWIEVVREGGRGRVEYHPSGEDCQMDAHERETTCKAGEGVAEAFGCGAIGQEILFVFCNQVYVFLDVALGHAL